jgi:hypothetical protein
MRMLKWLHTRAQLRRLRHLPCGRAQQLFPLRHLQLLLRHTAACQPRVHPGRHEAQLPGKAACTPRCAETAIRLTLIRLHNSRCTFGVPVLPVSIVVFLLLLQSPVFAKH